MRGVARAWGQVAPIAALAAAACASPGSRAAEEPPPSFTRGWRAYTPEELNRDVVACAEAARTSLAADAARWREPDATLRRALHERTTACMEQRGWEPR